MRRSELALAVVADTSALAKILDEGFSHLLHRAFGTVLLPRQVEQELRRKGPARRRQLKRLIKDGVIERCSDYQQSLITTWHGMLGRAQETKDMGEAEALAQCQSRDVPALFMNDWKAAKLAFSQGWRVIRPTELIAAVGDT